MNNLVRDIQCILFYYRNTYRFIYASQIINDFVIIIIENNVFIIGNVTNNFMIKCSINDFTAE